MKVYINYSDSRFIKQQKFALTMAKYFGRFDRTIGFSPDDIDINFYNKNKNILQQKRGGGYWLWKPYLIYKTLNQLNEGDYLFYSDSGAFFLKPVDILINELKKSNQDIMGFELPLIEEQWSKKELFLNIGCDEDKYYKSNQMLASFILIEKTDESVCFFKEYLNYSCNEVDVTDKYDETIKQVGSFIDHRHDQSIFSLLYKKYNLRPFKDPSQFGKFPAGYADQIDGVDTNIFGKLQVLKSGREIRLFEYEERYKFVLYHNRKGPPIVSLMKFGVKVFLSKLGYRCHVC